MAENNDSRIDVQIYLQNNRQNVIKNGHIHK